MTNWTTFLSEVHNYSSEELALVSLAASHLFYPKRSITWYRVVKTPLYAFSVLSVIPSPVSGLPRFVSKIITEKKKLKTKVKLRKNIPQSF